jgi:hydrogenase large subunit
MKDSSSKSKNLVEMNWDPITRIVGSLGIFTKIDFENRRVAECHSTSSIFRGYSIFMKGKDPRDAHFITSRICGICGDNHATCATYAQNMAFGIKPPAIAEWIINLGEAAEYMFDHNIFQDNLVGVDFCEQMVKETNPGVLAKAEKTASPHANLHGYRTIADIMRALNPFTGAFYREALQMSRLTREMFCLMEGRHVHPVHSVSRRRRHGSRRFSSFTDYLVRLMKYVEFMKKVVPLHDDLFDFFYEALARLRGGGPRRILLGCWGSFNNPDVCDYTYKNMSKWGKAMFVTPGVVVDGQLVTHDLVDINLNIRILWAVPTTTIGKLGNLRQDRSPGQSGRSAPSVEPNHNSPAAEARLRREVHLGDVAALARQAHRAIISRSIPVADPSRVSGPRRSPASSTSATSRRPATA